MNVSSPRLVPPLFVPRRLLLGAMLAALFCSCLHAGVVGHWDFEGGSLKGRMGGDLLWVGSPPADASIGTTASFGVPGPGGRASMVLRVPRLSSNVALSVPLPSRGNGGGTRLNQYTVVLDLYFTTTTFGTRCLWQADATVPSTTDGEFFLNGSHAIGGGGVFHGFAGPGSWRRVVFTVDLTRRTLGKYINGINVLSAPAGVPPLGTEKVQYLDPADAAIDGRWSVSSSALLFADDDAPAGLVYLDGVQILDQALSPAQVSALGRAGAAGIPFLLPGIAHYDLDGSFAPTTVGSNLTAVAFAPAVTADTAFVGIEVNGSAGQGLRFGRGSALRWVPPFEAPADFGAWNAYTLIMDVRFDGRPSGWSALWQASPTNVDDADWFVRGDGGLGVGGVYGGTVPDGQWNRLALVVDAAAGTLSSYINGAQVQQLSGLVPEGRFSLRSPGYLFGDENGENSAGVIGCVQWRASALSAAEIASLGGASAAGIPLPNPTIVHLDSPNGGQTFQAGQRVEVRWTATDPVGPAVVELWRGAERFVVLGSAPLSVGRFDWTVPEVLGDTNTYSIRVRSQYQVDAFDASDAPFAVSGTGVPSNPELDVNLALNGGFETRLAGWVVQQGDPTTLDAQNWWGNPRSGARFFHGGIGNHQDATVRQDIALGEHGFSAGDLSQDLRLEASGWLRNLFGAGAFDDQVFYRIGYLDAAGTEISSLRCILAGDSVWLSRPLTGIVPRATRTLRLEIVGRNRADRDNDSMADDMEVRLVRSTGRVTPRIMKQPMLQGIRADSMQLLWETDGNLCDHEVQWGRSQVSENSFLRVETLQIDSTHFVHRADIPGLEIETGYVYRVRSGGSFSPEYRFRTAVRPETPFAVCWWGDNHDGTSILTNHVARILTHGPDFIAVAGDMVNNGNNLSDWHDYWFKPLEYGRLAQTTPVVFARGNHDGEHALAYAYSMLPGNESWFAFTYGNTRFLFLDTEAHTFESPEQLEWLSRELESPESLKAAFRIACFHRPPFVNLWNGGGHTGEIFVQNDWVPLFRKGRVDMVISGHAHNYNRGALNGTVYVVSGGGGGFLDVERVANWPHFQVEYSSYHFDLMQVNGDQLIWETYDNRNRQIDTFQIQSLLPRLEWETPARPASNPTLVLHGRPGSSYSLQESADLKSWGGNRAITIPPSGRSELTTGLPDDGGHRFFRALLNP